MPTQYSPNAGLPCFEFDDRNWHLAIIRLWQRLDGLAAIGPLAVRPAVIDPASGLAVGRTLTVAAGSYRRSGGAIATFAGATGVTVPAASTSYLYLTADSGVLQQSTAGFPGTGEIVRLAIVQAGATAITQVIDARIVFASTGA